MFAELGIGVALLLLTGCNAQEPFRPTITSPSGQIQGTTESCGTFCTYYSFKGIPYAQPPVGALRFRNPVPHPGWSGVRDGAQHGAVCLQGEPVRGSEDCLFLNIFTQNLIGTRPVMVWIHGGAYTGGSGNVEDYGPEKFVQEDVVVVSINYRLGVLGFLSTGDRYAQGNWGLKDCVQALRWVQANILAFGGDPNSVTIFGNSAGAALVHLLVLTDAADGLFHKAIAQSSTALVPYSFQPNPRFYAERLATAFGLSSDSSVLVEQLRSIQGEAFVPLQEELIDMPVPRFLRPLDFGPVIEPEDSPEARIVTRTPISLIREHGHKVPFMAGYTNLEGAFFSTLESVADFTVKDQFNANPELLVPFFWNIASGSPSSAQVSNGFRNFYWQGRPLDASTDYEWMVYQTDHQFIYTIDQAVQLHAQASSVPLYYFQFSYDGDLNLFKRFSFISHPGAVHGDELGYLFNIPALMLEPVQPTSHALTVSQRMVRMWTNFARSGNPTSPADPLLQNVQWQPVQSAQEYLDIGTNLVPSQWPNQERFNLWRNLQQSYASDVFEFAEVRVQ